MTKLTKLLPVVACPTNCLGLRCFEMWRSDLHDRRQGQRRFRYVFSVARAKHAGKQSRRSALLGAVPIGRESNVGKQPQLKRIGNEMTTAVLMLYLQSICSRIPVGTCSAFSLSASSVSICRHHHPIVVPRKEERLARWAIA